MKSIPALFRPSARQVLTCVLAALLAIAAGRAHAAENAVEVLDTYPPGDQVTLQRNQNFYLRLHYATDRPIGIWAEPFFHGRPANAGTNGSPQYTNSGEALGWFFFPTSDGEVDEVRIKVGDGSRDGTSVVLTYPVHVVASSLQGPPETQPAWLGRLMARDAEQRQRASQAYANATASAGTSFLGQLFMWVVLVLAVGGFVLPARALLRWRGGWRLSAAVPAALMSFAVLRVLVGVSRDPTSHNLWPFEILVVAALSLCIMVALMLARRAIGAAAT
jgi:hypothetical protein